MRNISFKTKIALIFFVFYTFLSLYLISLFYFKSVLVQKEQLRQRLMQTADLGSVIVRAELVRNVVPVRSSMRTKEYRELVDKLRIVKDSHADIDDVYVLVDTSKPGIMKFAGNADEDELVDCGEEFDVTPYPELVKSVDGPRADREITQDRWGYWLSGYAPLRLGDGTVVGILGIDVSAETIGEMNSLIMKNALYVFLVGILFSVIAGNLAAWWLTKPMKVLLVGMGQIQSGNLDYKISIGTGDEFGKLGEAFNTMSGRLKKYIQDLTEATRDKERLNRELEIAAEMQRSMLPHYELKVDDVDLAGLSMPAKQVGGDYFDYMSGDGNNIGFVIADAAGKGLPSSIFMTNSKSIFKVLTTEERSPAKVIRRTNDLVIGNVDPSSAMFATMFYGIYDRDRRVFRYSNAGHNPPLFVDKAKGSVNLLNTHGCPIGVMEDQPYGEDEIVMKPGDAVVLYTDGVVEAVDEAREMFGMKRLTDICKETMDLSAQEVVNRIRDSVFEFAGRAAQHDDLTLLVFRIR